MPGIKNIRPLDEKELLQAITDTAAYIESGCPPETAWQIWFDDHDTRLLSDEKCASILTQLVTSRDHKAEYIMSNAYDDSDKTETAKACDELNGYIYRIGSSNVYTVNYFVKKSEFTAEYGFILNNKLFAPDMQTLQDEIEIYEAKSIAACRLRHAGMLIKGYFDKINQETGADIDLPAITVNTIYYDYGANMKWTTLVCDHTQILSPKDQKIIISGDEMDVREQCRCIAMRLHKRFSRRANCA